MKSSSKPASKACLLSLFAGFFLAFPPAALGQYSREELAYRLVSQGYKQLNSRNYREAIATLKEVLKQGPSRYSAGALAAIGSAHRSLKEYPEAISALRESLRVNPREKEAYYTFACVYLDTKRYEDALAALERFKLLAESKRELKDAEDLGKQISAYRYMESAELAIKQGRNLVAKDLLLQAAKEDPSPFSGVIHRQLAYVFRNLGNSSQAIEECQTALKFEPKNKSVNYTIGLCYKDLGQVDNAIAYLKRFAESEKDAEEKAKAREFIEDLEHDRELLAAPVSDSPDYLDALLANGKVHRWAKTAMPLRVYIGRGEGLTGYRENFPQFAFKAFDSWVRASGGLLQCVLVDRPQDSDIELEWTVEDLFKEEDDGKKRRAAGITHMQPATEAYSSFNSNPACWAVGHAKIRIQTINCFSREECTDDDILSTCLHEAGHALGIGGHSAYFSDIMFFGVSNKQLPALSKRDKATIVRIYQSEN